VSIIAIVANVKLYVSLMEKWFAKKGAIYEEKRLRYAKNEAVQEESRPRRKLHSLSQLRVQGVRVTCHV
jgi:hypothetical protein